MRARGFEADLAVGQSDFRCDIAVRRKGEQRYCLGVLIDDAHTNTIASILEQHVLRPGILNGFGWRIVRVTPKDWHHEREAVVASLLREASA
jgi:hypothetical protein